MAIIKCKMCGGDLVVEQGSTVAECEYCGTAQTVPTANDENLQNLFNRANILRIKSEFDKAERLYEQIIQADSTQADAYWGLILCKYGIEYVDDPKTFKKIPTCHRASYDSVIADDDYKSALKYADVLQRSIYEEQAKEIDRIQKEILALSQKEEKFDVFICYKETDAAGQRTQDSVIANDIYYELENQGYKVFYAAITLEHKIGSAYEPVIFAALNSAKVMLVLGTKAEYFNAVWVKNEWSRFLRIIKTDRSKLLIPCYRDMDAYELPEEFAHLQAQDMSKIGFINDIVRGIGKVIRTEEEKPTVIKETVVNNVSAGGAGIVPLLKRAFMFLEDGDWTTADEYCEKVLDLDPETAEAYLGKLMAQLKVKQRSSLGDGTTQFQNYDNYKKAYRFADEKLKTELDGYCDKVKENIRNVRYNVTVKNMNGAKTEKEFLDVKKAFELDINYKDSEELAKKCAVKAEECRKDSIYIDARRNRNKYTIESLREAKKLFSSIPDWKDSNEQAKQCNETIEKLLKEQEEKRLEKERLDAERRERERIELEQKKLEEKRMEEERKKYLRIALIAIGALVVFLIFLAIWDNTISPNLAYDEAVELQEAGNYDEAVAIFEGLKREGHRDCSNEIRECSRLKADKLFSEGNYSGAKEIYFSLREFEKAELCEYHRALALMEDGKNDDAIIILNKLGDYNDSKEMIKQCKYNKAIALMEKGDYKNAIMMFNAVIGFKDAQKKIEECSVLEKQSEYNSTEELYKSGKLGEAAIKFAKLGETKRSFEVWNEIADRETFVAGRRCTIGIKKNGTVVYAGKEEFKKHSVSKWKDIVAVAGGDYHTVGLKSDGTVVATGENGDNQCRVAGWTDIVAIAVGRYHTVGLKADGTVVATGFNGQGQLNVSDWKDIVAVAAGDGHTVGLKSDGTVVAVGLNKHNQCDIDTADMSGKVVSIRAGSIYTICVLDNGTCVVTGQENDWKDLVEVSGVMNMCGLKSDGTVVSTKATVTVDDVKYEAPDVSSWKDVIDISVGSYHVVGMKKDGTMIAAGNNEDKECDISEWKNIKKPN